MHELIRAATVELATFLATHLPTLGESWWKTHVADRLSFQQQRTVEERGLTNLEQLDFAALLRILDQNCCSARSLDADRRGKVLIRSDSGGSNDDAEQQQQAQPRAAAGPCVKAGMKTPWQCDCKSKLCSLIKGLYY